MVEEACTGDAFEDYVGRGYAESELDVFYLFPIEEIVGGADDRGYVCMAVTRGRLAARADRSRAADE